VLQGKISIDDPRVADVHELLTRHLTFAHEHSPPEDVHALDLDGLLDPAVTFFSFRDGGRRLLGVGALKQLDAGHAELKSIHTPEAVRGRGNGRAIHDHLSSHQPERCTRRRVSSCAGPSATTGPVRTAPS
jgi:putative acetyltransferase